MIPDHVYKLMKLCCTSSISYVRITRCNVRSQAKVRPNLYKYRFNNSNYELYVLLTELTSLIGKDSQISHYSIELCIRILLKLTCLLSQDCIIFFCKLSSR